ncbi:hypothetical protein O6H91_02G117200 [Diphasiastrum complanatum]|uniref:Uncharacterized protein n=1 Tax=Diphasiastrum complanatum TaxID=34168 RepID=A0ACC2EJS1_DIPCM|nr:hypothetical protein O6H91_02G117200 [Diphasiastrum complanatum]
MGSPLVDRAFQAVGLDDKLGGLDMESMAEKKASRLPTSILLNKERVVLAEALKKAPASEGKVINQPRAVSFWKLFQFADMQDIVLMTVGTIAAIVNGITLPTMQLIQSRLINNFGSLQGDPAQLSDKVTKDATYFVYIALIMFVSSYLEVSCWMRAGERQAARIRVKYLRAILRQNVGFFDSEISTAEVVTHVSADTLLVQDAISEKVGNFIKHMTLFVGGYLVGFLQVWKLTAVMLPFMPLLILPGSFYGKALSEFELCRQVAYIEAGTIAEQAISSIRTVYSFVGESRTLNSYSKSLELTVRIGLKQGLAKGLAVGSNGINFALWAIMAWYGSMLISQGHANGGQVLTTGFAVIAGGIALGNATPNLKAFSEGCIAAHRIFQMIERVPPIDTDDMRGTELAKVAGNLRLKNIQYAYPTRLDVPVLRNFNLDIPAGKTMALVGSSGSGKSTVIALLERFYDPLSGEVLLDGINIKALKLKWLRKQIGLVSQEPALFATSIKDNILHGKEGASMDEVIAAAKSANAHNFIIKFPNAYNTQVGERGVQLSGGQKQRIAIARAMIKNPPILLLDEATSALDTESEKIVQTALEEASIGRTTVIVAHRLSTIRNADLIAVLQSGQVVEIGHHEELIQKGENGAYAALNCLQQAQQAAQQNSPDGPLPKVQLDKESYKNLDLKSIDLKNVTVFQISNKNLSNLVSVQSVKAKPLKPSFRRLLTLNKPEWRQALLGLAVASFAVNIIQHYNFAAMGEYLTKRIREKMLAAIMRFEIAWFDRDENASGAICSRLASDANMVRALVGDRLSLLVQTASAISVSFFLGIITSWRLALVIISAQPLIIFCFYLKKICLQGFAQKSAKAQQEASQVASEAVSQHRTVTAFSSQEKVLALFESKLEAPMREAAIRSHIAGFGLGIAQFVLYASWSLAFWYGGVLVKQHRTTFGDVFKTFFVLLSTGRALGEAGTLTPDLAKGVTAVQSVFEILDKKPEIEVDNEQGEKPKIIKGDIELTNVYFAYPSRPNVMVFQNFSLGVQAGQVVALVGQSGSGKSTVIAMIERFYDPLRGKVKIDGLDIKQLNLKWLRLQIGLVSQEPTLFATSIRENIAYGKEGATDAEILDAARAANAHNFISALPNGYLTYAGERGLQLSGGQKQRIAIARAMLKNPAILLLDEATSALDTESERMVQGALDKMMVGRTTVVVAHRLSTIQNADKIAVVQGGAILEQGTHLELLSKGEGGAYFSLVHLQTAAGR